MKMSTLLLVIMLAGCTVPSERPMDYTVLKEWGDRVGTSKEILIEGPKAELEVRELLAYINEVEFPTTRFLMIWVFESQERYDDYQRCGDAWDDWPIPKFGEPSKGDPPECIEGEAKGNYFIAGIVRNPESTPEDIYFYQGR